MDLEKQMDSNNVDEVALAEADTGLEGEGEKWGEVKIQSQVPDF